MKIMPLCQRHYYQASLHSAIIRALPEMLSISHRRIKKTGDNAGGEKSEVAVMSIHQYERLLVETPEAIEMRLQPDKEGHREQ